MSGNPGPGGWAALIDDEMQSGPLLWVTNNEAEAYAILMAAMALPYGTHAVLFTDSQLCLKWFGRRGKCSNRRINDLSHAYRVVCDALDLNIRIVKVKGHRTCQGNLRADREAVRQRNIARRLIRE